MATGGPNAAAITVPETLALLDGPFAPVARGVAEDRYVLWLGSESPSVVSMDFAKSSLGFWSSCAREPPQATQLAGSAGH